MDIMINLHGISDVSVAFCLQRMGTIYFKIGNLEKAIENL
jgi:hypothetical protein